MKHFALGLLLVSLLAIPVGVFCYRSTMLKQAKRNAIKKYSYTVVSDDKETPFRRTMRIRRERILAAIAGVDSGTQEAELVGVAIDGTPPACNVMLDWINTSDIAGIRLLVSPEEYYDHYLPVDQGGHRTALEHLVREKTIAWPATFPVENWEMGKASIKFQLIGMDGIAIPGKVTPLLIEGGQDEEKVSGTD